MEEKGGKYTQTYCDTLDVISKQRYVDKLSLIGNQDPYTVEKQRWSLDIELLIQILLTFCCTQQVPTLLMNRNPTKELKLIISLCGWVRDVKVMEIN